MKTELPENLNFEVYVVRVHTDNSPDEFISFAPNGLTTQSIEETQIFLGEEELKKGVKTFSQAYDNKNAEFFIHKLSFPFSAYWTSKDVERL